MEERAHFKKFILGRVKMSPEELDELASAFNIRKVKKKQFIAQPGFIVRTRTFVVQGAAERSMARVFAAELAPKKIRVNTLSPGAITTPIFEKAGFGSEMAAQMESFFAENSPLKRTGTTEEMAKGFLFLASDDSSYMTGGDLLLDGGFANV
jgi:hypothetical protein